MREREFGSNLFERLAQGSETRRAMIAGNLGVWATRVRPSSGLTKQSNLVVGFLTEVEPSLTDLSPEKARQILLFSELWERFKNIASWTYRKKLELASVPALLLAAIGATCEGSEPKEPGDTSDNVPKVEAPIDKPEPEQFILPVIDTKDPDEPIFLNSGPHSDGLTGGVRAAIDLAGKNVMPCPGSETSKEMAAIAAARGKVTVVGNENDQNDENHSIVEIAVEDVTFGYMHLDDIQVKVGQTVESGAILGFLSCEIPPKGKTDGQHLHFYIKKDGKSIPIKGFIFSGWQIDESPQNYQGTAEKGDSLRVANKVRCDQERYLQVADCNEQRNDLVEGEVLGVRTVAPTATPILEKTSPRPDFELKSIDGRTIRLNDYRDRPVALLFLGDECTDGFLTQCRTMLLETLAMTSRYREKGVVTLAIITDRTDKDLINLLAGKVSEILLDEKVIDTQRNLEVDKVSILYGAAGFIKDQGGKDVYYHGDAFVIFLRRDRTSAGFTQVRSTVDFYEGVLSNIIGEKEPAREVSSTAFFDLGNLRVDITDWEEFKRKESTKLDGVSYKPVDIIGVVRNVGPKSVDLRVLNRFDKEAHYAFELVSKQGVGLSGSTSGMQQEIFQAGELNKSYKPLLLPPGFGIPVRIIFEVPSSETGYQLKVEAYKPAIARSSNLIRQNEVTKSSLIAAEAEIRNSAQRWDYPTLSLGYAGVSLESRGTARIQRVQFSVKNNKSEPIRNIDSSMRVLVYLKDGRVVYGSEGDPPRRPFIIQPGSTRNLRIQIGFDDSGYEDRSHFGIFDLKGSVVLLMLDSGEWAAWRIP